MSFLSIPPDVINEIIFDLINTKTILGLCLVCKQINEMVHKRSWTQKFSFRIPGKHNTCYDRTVDFLDKIRFSWSLKNIQFNGLVMGGPINDKIYNYPIPHNTDGRLITPNKLIFKECVFRDSTKLINYMPFFDLSHLSVLKLDCINCYNYRYTMDKISTMCRNLRSLSIIFKNHDNFNFRNIYPFSIDNALNKLCISYILEKPSFFGHLHNSWNVNTNNFLHITFLKLSGIDLSGVEIEKFTALQKLSIINCVKLNLPLDSISLTNLTIIESHYSIHYREYYWMLDNSFLPNLQKLKLEIYSQNTIDFEKTRISEKMKLLSIKFQDSGICRIRGITELKKLTNLEFLEIKHVNDKAYNLSKSPNVPIFSLAAEFPDIKMCYISTKITLY